MDITHEHQRQNAKLMLEQYRKKRQRHRKSAHRARVAYERALAAPPHEWRAHRIGGLKLQLLIAIERSRGSKVNIRRMETLYKQLCSSSKLE